MSTIEEFKNAPVGATATSPDGRQTYRRETKTQGGADWANDKGEARLWADADGLAHYGYTLDPAPAPAPTTAQEALDLAWNLAHPVKEGQTIPKGTRYVHRSENGGLTTFTATEGWTLTPRYAEHLRTLDPLPDPEPDWLDAPAVMARLEGWVSCADPQVFSRENKTGTQWLRDTKVYRWDELTDVVPLYPKGHDAPGYRTVAFRDDTPWGTGLGGDPA